MRKEIIDLITVAEMLKDPRIVSGDDLDSLRLKAKMFDELEPRLEDLIDEYWKADCLGSDAGHLFEQIESIITHEHGPRRRNNEL